MRILSNKEGNKIIYLGGIHDNFNNALLKNIFKLKSKRVRYQHVRIPKSHE